MEMIIRLSAFSIVGVIILTMLGNYGASGASMQNLGRIVIISVILLAFIPKISLIFDTLIRLADLGHINDVYFRMIMKIIGLTYIVEFSSSMCADMGESAIASKIELGGKIGILLLSLPIINAFIVLIQSLVR